MGRRNLDWLYVLSHCQFYSRTGIDAEQYRFPEFVNNVHISNSVMCNNVMALKSGYDTAVSQMIRQSDGQTVQQTSTYEFLS